MQNVGDALICCVVTASLNQSNRSVYQAAASRAGAALPARCVRACAQRCPLESAWGQSAAARVATATRREAHRERETIAAVLHEQGKPRLGG